MARRWYVIQVLGGQEKATLELVESLAGDAADEAFIPQREIMRHRAGAWVRSRETLFPGYVFVVARDPAALSERLSHVPAFTRLLGSEGGFAPLADDEVKLIQALSDGEHVVGMSEGIIEGDVVRILRGPLRDHEATIAKIDRHRRSARVKMHILGRETVVTLGLEIAKKV